MVLVEVVLQVVLGRLQRLVRILDRTCQTKVAAIQSAVDLPLDLVRVQDSKIEGD